MLKLVEVPKGDVINMRQSEIDALDARLLLELGSDARATVLGLATTLGISRNTVQARLNRLDARGVLGSYERCIDPAALGYPLTAYVTADVVQRKLAQIARALDAIPEIVQVVGVSGASDLLIHVVARDADDLYRVAGTILATDGVQRTETALAMRHLVDYRVAPLLHHCCESH